ncbi:hypothetical protein SDC9_171568 [bioreactor metagenome]|uniref:Uncharacterized protein n=1 Tax=bioreactor metagenome TaxID=1076179 RepID=A0A645GJR5_9ZZZZ
MRGIFNIGDARPAQRPVEETEQNAIDEAAKQQEIKHKELDSFRATDFGDGDEIQIPTFIKNRRNF